MESARNISFSANTRHRPKVKPMLSHRLRRWPNIGATLGRCLVFTEIFQNWSWLEKTVRYSVCKKESCVWRCLIHLTTLRSTLWPSLACTYRKDIFITVHCPVKLSFSISHHSKLELLTKFTILNIERKRSI